MNTRINDDMLSAFLDGELPEQELQAVRAAVASDPVLADRLAALRRVNELVTRHASALDPTPLPATVLALLQTESVSAAPKATVLQGPWQRWSRHAGARMALAAGLVLTLAVAMNYLRTPAPGDLPALAAYTAQLDSAPSGATTAVGAATLVNRFSFRDRDDRYCRQYLLSQGTTGSENVACHTEQGWALVVSLPVVLQADVDTYQPASSSAELNAVLDTMMDGAALDLAAEASAIQMGWQDE
jgi:hypothetical protein